MEKDIGRIHSIETCGTVDGPGIRYVVFMQGCPLRCKYCHNCDTWEVNGGNLFTVEQLVEDILKYKNYLHFSGGGITISGGEPTLQAPFITSLFKELKKHNIHTAIDSCGYTHIHRIEELLNYTDLVLLDIKHIDPISHKDLTGKDNGKILEFAKYLSNKDIKVWIRHVVVPGITDNKNDLRKLIAFIKSLKNVEKVELLPYHPLGIHKWEEMGYEYTLKDTPTPTPEEMETIQEMFLANNIEAVI